MATRSVTPVVGAVKTQADVQRMFERDLAPWVLDFTRDKGRYVDDDVEELYSVYSYGFVAGCVAQASHEENWSSGK